MEKRVWENPVTMVQRFEPNEYCSACGEGPTVYKFKCTARGGALYYYPNSDGNIDGNYEGQGRAHYIGSYHPCGESHRAFSTDPFYDGFVDYNGNGKQDRGEGVIVWRGEWGMNGHATDNLDMKSWETEKS